MDLLTDFGKFLQISISLVTLVGAIAKGTLEFRKILNESKAQSAGKTRPATTVAISNKSRWLDLAFVLLCSAIFSLLILDALVISGRRPDVFYSVIASFIVTIFVGVALMFAWYRGSSALGIGWGATITLFLLILAPGGPFVEGEKGGIEGMNLWIPTITLLLLSLTMWIYKLGYPFDRTLPVKTRLRTILVVSGIIAGATISLGKQYKNLVLDDRRSPDIRSESVQAALNKIDQDQDWTTLQTRAFYAAMSDVYLTDWYEVQWKTVTSDIDQRTGESVSESRRFRLNRLLTHFSNLDAKDQRIFLANRLKWVHPVGLNDQDQSPINLPGILPADRLETLSTFRIRHALSSQPTLAQSLIEIHAYNEQINNEFDLDQISLRALQQYGPLPLSLPTNEFPEIPDAFPPIEVDYSTSQLQEQLSLPLADEVYLALEETD
jgi:hypothetical protein